MSRVVIFGGTGFIGSALSLAISSLGHEVIILGRNLNFTLPNNVKFHEIDFEKNDTWANILCESDYVCYLIGINLPLSLDLSNDGKKGIESFEQLLNLCVIKSVKNFLYLSSGGSIYGQANYSFKETDELNPISSYGKLKVEFEKKLKRFNIEYGLPFVIARPSNVYGKNQKASVIGNFFYKISNNLPIDIWGDLSICKDYLHIDDLVPVLTKMCLDNASGIYNLGFGKTYSLGEVIQAIEIVLNKKAICNFHAFRENDIHHYSLDCSKARRELLFNPTITLEDGIKSYI